MLLIESLLERQRRNQDHKEHKNQTMTRCSFTSPPSFSFQGVLGGAVCAWYTGCINTLID
ncbi:hypothetical protein GBF38_015680 [Nibea albiflora]|uniref:Uncharacterized protein n=1 Tax=Nibea albiflora TaxID=240163 RepID=A0ACB7ELU6_NIBAL|nr:hypothetical protein GBF38_015680 [Nibea albiflora]